jgi:polyisoprenoid-binding protein YceI
VSSKALFLDCNTGLYHFKLVPKSWIFFDKAYTTYNQFAKWADQKIRFVTRDRGNADFHVTKVLIGKTRQRKVKGQLLIVVIWKKEVLKIPCQYDNRHSVTFYQQCQFVGVY